MTQPLVIREGSLEVLLEAHPEESVVFVDWIDRDSACFIDSATCSVQELVEVAERHSVNSCQQTALPSPVQCLLTSDAVRTWLAGTRSA